MEVSTSGALFLLCFSMFQLYFCVEGWVKLPTRQIFQAPLSFEINVTRLFLEFGQQP